MHDSDSESESIPESLCFWLESESRKSNCVEIMYSKDRHISKVLVEPESKDIDWNRSGIREFFLESEDKFISESEI